MSRRYSRTTYPAGECVASIVDARSGIAPHQAEHMPLCAECRVVWEHDGDTWLAKGPEADQLRKLAAAWQEGYHRGLRKAGMIA